mgnify:CR=1 FL=1|jgi:hypothetical protein
MGKVIQELENLQVRETSYLEAKKLIAEYQTNLGTVKNRPKAENDAKKTLSKANCERKIQHLIAS